MSTKNRSRAQIVLAPVLLLLNGSCSGEPEPEPRPKVIATADIENPSFENGVRGWHFYFNESQGKVVQGGFKGSKSALLSISPDKQLDGFSQSIVKSKSNSIGISAYVMAKGTDISAKLRIECIKLNPPKEDGTYGMLAKAESLPADVAGVWQHLSASVIVPEKTDLIRVFALVHGTDGEARFDEFEVSRN